MLLHHNEQRLEAISCGHARTRNHDPLHHNANTWYKLTTIQDDVCLEYATITHFLNNQNHTVYTWPHGLRMQIHVTEVIKWSTPI